jgi:hypothetical protein
MRIESCDLIGVSKMGTNLAGSLNSSAILIEHIAMVGLSLAWTGTFNGSFKIQVSNDTHDTPTYWHDINSSVINVAAGSYLGAAGYTYSLSDCSYRWIRLAYTFTSSTGTLTSCDLMLKGV